MRRREQERADYRPLNILTGNRIQSRIQRPTMADDGDEITPREQLIVDLSLEVDIMRDEISDYIEEICYFTKPASDVLSQLGKHRTTFRSKHYKLRHYLGATYDEKYATEYETLINNIAAAIKATKEEIKSIKIEATQLSADQLKTTKDLEEEAMLFQVESTDQSLKELQMSWEKNVKLATDEQLLRWKENQESYLKSFINATEKYQESLKFNPTGQTLVKAKQLLGKRYTLVVNLKSKFNEDLTSEIDRRELNKRDLMKETKLNIKLSKFSGYDSDLDIYTFQSEFEKLHLRTTTKRLLPDLLINNHLSEPALSLVKHLDNIDEIWGRLKEVYGDTKFLLTKKISSLSDIQSFKGSRDPGKIIAGISQMINLMRDLMTLASKHGIEKCLYYGDALDTVYKLMGDSRVTKWLEQSVEVKQTGKVLWRNVIDFLERELKIQQQNLRLQGKEDPPAPPKNPNRKGSGSSYHSGKFDNEICILCGSSVGENDHVATTGPGGVKVIQYFSCRKFVEKTPAQRLQMLRKKGLCFQCLSPGAKWNVGKHEEGKCQHDFVCPHGSHSKYPKKKHILICEEHKDFDENQELLEKYKTKFISRNSSLPSFSRDIKLSFYSEISSAEVEVNRVQTDFEDQGGDIPDRGIYMFQSIKVNGEVFNIFFDSGCSDFIVRKSAVDRLGSHVTLISNIPVSITGVGKKSTAAEHGIYRVQLPLISGETAVLRGTCLTDITGEFPLFPLKEAEKDLCFAAGPLAKTFPKVPSHIGGNIDFMIGMKYLKYHPKPIFALSTGLTIFKSVFRGADGTTGIIGGPHESFSKIRFQSHFCSPSFFNDMPNIMMVSALSDSDLDHSSFKANPLKSFENAENAGSQITYRCVSCRECKDCRTHDSIESISLKEEAEQALIESSVSIDIESRITTARLPVLYDPAKRLAPNKSVALKVYEQQVRKLNKPENAKDKTDVLESEAKLQKLGYVEYVKDLPEHIQSDLKRNPVQNFIPWRAVWKPSSVTTPCRVVFDASMPTPSGSSLNDILAKGKNGLNKLQEIVIRWSTHSVGLHTDISKMFNTIRLDERDWCLQRYLWHESLDPSKPPEQKVIKTLIYGVKPSGNKSEYGLRKVAEMSSNESPEASRIVRNDIYVDDCISGESFTEKAHKRADEVETVVNRGGFQLKGVSFSGEDPQENLSEDGKSLTVAGLKWLPKDDLLSLNVGDLNFAKRQRGKKPEAKSNIIPSVLTKRHCASKVGEIYDLLGKTTPITATFKIDLHDLVLRKLDWDDPIPSELRDTWLNNFQLMQDLRSIHFKRCIIPEDALSLQIETIDAADASEVVACSAIYARIKRRDGSYHCQLIFSRSKLLPDGISQPRGEMIAAIMNVHTSEVVSRSFGALHKSSIKLSDSQVVLHWIHNEEKPLKKWVRSRVIEIRRLSSPDDWFYVSSQNMIADVGTRKGVQIEDISQDSDWINGLPWMSKDQSEFPTTRISDLTLSKAELSKVNEETLPHQTHFLSIPDQSSSIVPDEVKERYQFSNYLIDPNRYRFSKVVRILSYIYKFIRLKFDYSPIQRQKATRSQDIDAARAYYFRKCTEEVKHFLPESKYKKISKTNDGILYYTGRILSCDDFTITGKFTKVMKDLTSTTFCVPIVDKHSPVAYAIINEAHWYNESCSHRGIKTTIRYVLMEAYIFELRSIVKKVKKSCQRCRYLMKKTIEVSMGPLPSFNLTIAPAFYVSQVDLSGPYKAYSKHNKRTTLKIWLVVFCCCTTSSVSIKVMDDYTTPGFIQAFIRFASDSGFPKTLLCDEGSQLIKACTEMKLNFKDTMDQLHRDVGVEYNTCPVGGHNFHGKVERKIKEINLSIEKATSNCRLSLLQWETLGSMIANCINNLPIAIRNEVSDFEAIDLLTPNRLRLGRNNERCPHGEMVTTFNPLKVVDENVEIFNAWFEVWLLHVPNFMSQSKWFRNDKPLSKGDVVLFTKQESVLCKDYQYGIVDDVQNGKDGKARRASVRYKNHQEKKFRFTNRAIRSLVLIQSVDELDIMTELATMACLADSRINASQ